MSVRIHEISKQTGVSSKEIIELLKERGYEVSTASSGIDPISAESLIQELGGIVEPEAPDKPVDEVKAPPPAKKPEEKPVNATPPPLSTFVRSKEDIDREKEDKRVEEEQVKAKGPPPVTSQTAPKVALPPLSASAAPAPMSPTAAPSPALGSGAPPPLAGKPPPTLGIGAPPPTTPPEDEGEEAVYPDDLEVLTVKPPIVVKEFAVEIGLKPFRLISELMEISQNRALVPA